jgi:prepilin-type N-terminal cleavage/methylation domain-containing protein
LKPESGAEVHRRAGFSLVEITVALALTLIVTGAAYRLILASQRLSRAQASQLGLQTNARTASIAVLNELRELGTVTAGSSDQNDVLGITVSGITYRAARGIGFLCQPPSANRIRIARGTFSGYRDPQSTRDVAYVFLDGSPDTEADDSWLGFPIVDVATGIVCPGTSSAGLTLTTSGALPPDVPAGTPVRIYEVMELRSYQSEGKWWLGARAVGTGEAIQPMAGPLADRDGFRLEYSNAAGVQTADPTAIKSVKITVNALGEDSVSAWSGARIEEELVTAVTLRNGFRR